MARMIQINPPVKQVVVDDIKMYLTEAGRYGDGGLRGTVDCLKGDELIESKQVAFAARKPYGNYETRDSYAELCTAKVAGIQAQQFTAALLRLKDLTAAALRQREHAKRHPSHEHPTHPSIVVTHRFLREIADDAL